MAGVRMQLTGLTPFADLVPRFDKDSEVGVLSEK
jgi:hypothetical protein